jgi:hypothetical protein
MEERDFFDERPEQRTHTMTCPHCGQAAEYELSWIVRRKKTQLPRGADDRDRARFAKAQATWSAATASSVARTSAVTKRFRWRGSSQRSSS